MNNNVLVAYASVSGSTGEVAEAIGEVFEEKGLTASVQPMKTVIAIQNYDIVIAGSSIRAGKWLPEAIHFLERFHGELSQKSVAYFTTCLTMVDDTEDSRRTVLAYMEPIFRKTPDVKPVGLGLFAGSFDPDRQLMMPVEGPQGDYRNWEAIRTWAAEVASALLEGGVLGKPASELPYTIILRHAALAYTDMSRADLHAVDLTGADLYEANLSQSDLHEANLNWAELNWADMSGADLNHANLIGADLEKATIDGANLSYAVLNGADLSHANLSGTDLSYADLNWADLRDADLSEANLSGANLGWANLSGANLSGANLDQTKYNANTVWPEGFSAADHGGILIEVGPR